MKTAFLRQRLRHYECLHHTISTCHNGTGSGWDLCSKYISHVLFEDQYTAAFGKCMLFNVKVIIRSTLSFLLPPRLRYMNVIPKEKSVYCSLMWMLMYPPKMML